MSTFMQLMEGKRGAAAAGIVESVRVTKAGTMFFKMDGKEVCSLFRVLTSCCRLGFVSI